MERTSICCRNYTDSKPGLIFEVIKAVDCQTKWSRFTGEKAKLGQAVLVRLDLNFNRHGTLKYLGNHNECLCRFSELMEFYSSGNHFPMPDMPDPVPHFHNHTKNKIMQPKIYKFLKK